MDVNGVSSYSRSVAASTNTSSAAAKETAEKTSGYSDVAATYEHTSTSSSKTYKPNLDLVNQLKADAEARTSQLRSLVEEMMSKQGSTFGTANYGEDSMWRFLAKGNFTVTEAAKLEAQEAISENGYWGVKQTSERILSFAKALTGGDPSKIEEMRTAFEKGFSQATKAWGQNLPSISNDTYDAVMAGFDKWAEEGV